jgi:hypothetical protein
MKYPVFMRRSGLHVRRDTGTEDAVIIAVVEDAEEQQKLDAIRLHVKRILQSLCVM